MKMAVSLFNPFLSSIHSGPIWLLGKQGKMKENCFSGVLCCLVSKKWKHT